MRFKEFFQENLTRPASLSTWQTQLQRKGWIYAGGGSFATVYTHPKKNYVLKFFDNDPGYSIFLDFLESENQDNNPCVVKLRRNIFKNPDGPNENVQVVALEKLNPLENKNHFFFETIRLFVHKFRYIKITNESFEEVLQTIYDDAVKSFRAEAQYAKGFSKNSYKHNTRILRSLPTFIKQYRPLIETIFEMKKFMQQKGSMYQFDLHGSNFMIRPTTGQIVITDPLSYIDRKYEEL